MADIDKSLFIPHKNWKDGCKAVYYLKTGDASPFDGDVWLAESTDKTYTSGWTLNGLLPYQVQYPDFDPDARGEHQNLISKAELVWSSGSNYPEKKKIKLIDRGGYFETVEV